ncbi:MAG TPA: sigma-70 family RNA polymerase sigma factor [Gemmatimonadaceae bacterium]|nr:sigma-70 family RNA polymerase sigma factor [Gemmatimonadaceae bacterium]
MTDVARISATSAGADERWLIAQARQGDRGAARRLYDDHVRRVHRLVYRICGDEELAHDLTQDTFVRAFGQLDAFRGEAAFGTWLHRIAVSVALNGLRKVRRLRDRERPMDDSSELYAAPERHAEPDLRDRLYAAIGALPEALRVTFVLYHVEGYSHVEIGQMLGIAEGTSKARVFEARGRLREALADFQ